MQSNESTIEILVSSRVYLVLNLDTKSSTHTSSSDFFFLLLFLYVSDPIYKNNLFMEEQFVNPCSLSDRDLHITGRLGNKHTF